MNSKQAVGFIGTGIFLYLILATLEFTFSRILHESLIWTKGYAIVIHALTVFIPVIFIIGLFIFALKWIKTKLNEGTEIKVIFKTTIVIYIMVVVLQFGFTLLEGLYQNLVYFDLLESYRATLSEQLIYRQFLIDTPAWIIKYVIIGILIFKEIKTLPNTRL